MLGTCWSGTSVMDFVSFFNLATILEGSVSTGTVHISVSADSSQIYWRWSDDLVMVLLTVISSVAVFLGLLDLDPDPDPSIVKQK
jgi:hypothetical protein